MNPLQSAVENNALWCNTICRAHGLPTAIDANTWRCLAPAPPFYPNVVTLRAKRESVLADVRAMAPALAGGWAVKDSFATLDLNPLGFEVLFDATWVWRPARVSPSSPAMVRWQVVRDSVTLARWEAAWAEGEAPGDQRLFLPTLLADPTIHFLAGIADDQIVAGAILMVTGKPGAQVVGLSNTFAAPGQDGAACWSAAADQAASLAPGLPVVGYEHGEPLAWAHTAGFAALGPLRIWSRRIFESA